MGSVLNQYLAVIFGKYDSIQFSFDSQSRSSLLFDEENQLLFFCVSCMFSEFMYICIFHINRMDWDRSGDIRFGPKPVTIGSCATRWIGMDCIVTGHRRFGRDRSVWLDGQLFWPKIFTVGNGHSTNRKYSLTYMGSWRLVEGNKLNLHFIIPKNSIKLGQLCAHCVCTKRVLFVRIEIFVRFCRRCSIRSGAINGLGNRRRQVSWSCLANNNWLQSITHKSIYRFNQNFSFKFYCNEQYSRRIRHHISDCI